MKRSCVWKTQGSEKGKRVKLSTAQGKMNRRLTLYWWEREIESI